MQNVHKSPHRGKQKDLPKIGGETDVDVENDKGGISSFDLGMKYSEEHCRRMRFVKFEDEEETDKTSSIFPKKENGTNTSEGVSR